MRIIITMLALLSCVALGWWIGQLTQMDAVQMLTQDCSLIGWAKSATLSGNMVYLGDVGYLCKGGVLK